MAIRAPDGAKNEKECKQELNSDAFFFAGLAKWPEQLSPSTWRSTKLPSPDQLLLAGDLVLVLESKLIKQFSIYFTECHCPSTG